MRPDRSATVGASGSGEGRSGTGRESFAADELAIVLSNFEIGVIESITDYPRGSRKAPKLLIVSDQGKYLLKRRARGKDDPFKVAFTHSLQGYLASQQFPLPHLIGTRRQNNSMLQVRGAVYELFEYIPGQGYPQTLEATGDSGRVLGLYHKLVERFQSEWLPPRGGYHRAAGVEQGIHTIASIAPIGGLGENADLHQLLKQLLGVYRAAGDRVEALGLESWPRQIVHADWHPGNMLYRDNHVVAVIDYDSARLLPRIVDIANGALQFSIIAGEDDMKTWPEYLDESRFKRFLKGYDQVMLLSQAEVETIPWLMIEALVAEAVFPIAATGSFGRLDGVPFLQMVQRKTSWVWANAMRLIELVEQ